MMKKKITIDENMFFREASLRICRTLEFEEALKDCLNYIKDFMPADLFCMNLQDRGLHALKIIATITHAGIRRTNIFIPVDKSTWEFIKSRESLTAYILDPSEIPPLKASMCRQVDLPEVHSVMIIHLGISHAKFGNLILIAHGNNRFNAQHLKLFSILREPFSIALSNALRYCELKRLKDALADDVEYFHQKLRSSHGNKIIGENNGLKAVMDLVKSVAPMKSPVLLLGETGVGKEMIANAIHNMSRRSEGPFIQVNCGAISETLIDSELFGHEKGAFTGAVAQRRGCFERAHNGTIFLDEIGELPLHAQVKMLRVLQEKKIMRVGGSKDISVNIRIIAATHQNLDKMVRDNLFRSDLHFRLNVFPITIPPLRDRKEDIPELVYHFIAKKMKEMLISGDPNLSEGSVCRLMTYDWPGNVRELENVIERALILSKNGSVTFDNIINSNKTESLPGMEKSKNEFLPLDKMTSAYIKYALSKTNGRIHGPQGAANLLKINPNTLRSRMKKLGLLPRPE